MTNYWFLTVLILFGLSHVALGDLPGCFQSQDNATVPECYVWIDANDGFPVFFPHQYNCSRYWVCDQSLGEACLRECPPAGNHEILYFDYTIDHQHGGPVCTWPREVNCTNKSPECAKCEAWQDCQVLDDGTVICTPDCKMDVHCNGDEYCDFNEGGGGNCHKGCRTNEPCGTKPCAECLNHVCNDPECCVDADCPDHNVCENGKCKFECVVDDDCESTEYCDNGECKLGCRDDSGCTGMICSTCENHVCVDPECCTDEECLDTEYCTDNQECAPGCNENSDCSNTECSTCDLPNHQCVDPECCKDDDCQGQWICENGQCKPECVTDDDCESNEYCDTVAGICKEGCRDDAGCTTTSCSTCENHVCVDPECCVDEDCVSLDEPICQDYECIPGCRVDTMCPKWDGICDANYTTCDYCFNPDNDIGECKPGCISDANCNGMECAGHQCVTIGTTVLETVEFTTASCDSCTSSNDEPGISVFLIGGNSMTGKNNCTSRALDHDDRKDYGEGVNAVFGRQDQEQLYGCYLANFQSKVTGGNVIWNGEGTWSPKDGKIYFTWSDPSTLHYVCTLSPASLSAGSSADLVDCKEDI